jgi:kinesin family protein C1
VYTLIKGLGRQRQTDLCEIEASLGCRASSRTARASQRNPVSKKKKRKEKQNKKTKTKERKGKKTVFFFFSQQRPPLLEVKRNVELKAALVKSSSRVPLSASRLKRGPDQMEDALEPAKVRDVLNAESKKGREG